MPRGGPKAVPRAKALFLKKKQKSLQNLNSRIDEVDKKSEERAKRSENT